MADPNSIADIFNVSVQYVPNVAIGRFGFANPTFIDEFAANASFPGRVKSYTGTYAQKLAAIAADGFATTSAVYRMAQSASIQDGPPRTIYVGRKDAGDADWGEAVLAVKAAADMAGLSFYCFCADTRDATDIETIADAIEGDPEAPVFALYIAQTDDANVFANNPGNVAANILAKNYSKTALLWHDPAAASGYGPAILESGVGTFVIPNGSTLDLRIDGGATQSFTFVSAAATLLGSLAETYAIADGDTLVVAVDSGSAQTITFAVSAATVLSSLAETYNFTDGMSLSLRVDGGAVQTATFNGTAGFVATVGGDPFALNDGETVTFDIDGSGNQVVTFNTGDFVDINNATAEELTLVYQAQLTGVVVTDDGSNVTVTSARLGSSSNAEIVAGTGTALANLGYSVGDNFGSGFAAFLDAATALEVATEINADTTDCTAADDGGYVRITSDLVGKLSRVQVTGGTANAVLGFDTNEYAGSGDFNDASAATATEVVAVINARSVGLVATVDTAKVRLTSKLVGSGSRIDVDASAVATALGLSLTAVDGSGDFYDSKSATAGEVALKISATLTGAVASSASSKVVITSATSGSTSTVQAVGGSLLTVLRFVDATTSVSNLATGTGVLEDYADCAWVGRCITFDLDAPGGAAIWDGHQLSAPSPTGAGVVALKGDVFDPAEAVVIRERLHDTLRVNTYEPRFGSAGETHFGTVLNDQLGAGGYIDVRTTVDWLQARITEDFKAINDAASAAKTKISYSDPSTGRYAQALRNRLQLSERNGHTFYDGNDLNLNDPQATGVFVPTIAQQTQADIDARLIRGYQAQQRIQGAIQRGVAVINLIGPTGAQ